MAIEDKRACGYRKVGGLYVVSGGFGALCCKLPVMLHICPTCNGGVKQMRGWQWIDPQPWLKGDCTAGQYGVCPAASPHMLGEKVGLLWIGVQFYPTTESFAEEARRLGVSRRITAVPRGFKVGEHFVFLAHPRIRQDPATEEWQGGVFHIFRPTAIEKIVTRSEAADEAAMEKLRAAGITPVVVPDDDKDHQGSVYDAEPELGLAEEGGSC